MKNLQNIFIVFVFIALSFNCSFQLFAQTTEGVFNQETLTSLSLDELKLTKKRLLRQKKYQATDLVDVEIQKRYKTKKQNKIKQKEQKQEVEEIEKKMPSISALKIHKQEAIKNEQYLLAAKIKNQILSLESKVKNIVPNKEKEKLEKSIVKNIFNKEKDKTVTKPKPEKHITTKPFKNEIKVVKLINKERIYEPIKPKETKTVVVNNKKEEKVVPVIKSLSKEKIKIIKTIDTPVTNEINDEIEPEVIVKPKILPKHKEVKPKIIIHKELPTSTLLVANNVKKLETSQLKKTTNTAAAVEKKEKTIVNKPDSEQITSLENQKQIAINNKKYLLADKLEKQIQLIKSKPNITYLENQKQIAINNKKYLLADKLEKQIQAIKSKPNITYLESQKQIAINNKEYLLADKLEKQIQAIKHESIPKKQESIQKSETVNLNKKTSLKLDNLVKEESKTTTFKTINTFKKENTSFKKIVKKEKKKGANDREDALFAMMNENNITSSLNSNTNSIVSFTSSANNSRSKVVRHASNNSEIKYRRSSLYTLMIENTSREHSDAIRNTFGNQPIPEKFNNHNIGPYLIHSNIIKKDQSNDISSYLNTNDVAKKLIAKWFNRNEKGEFNMQLVAERGNYNATDLDVIIARNNERGDAMLVDAGEELIGNTFVIINDYKYTNKEKVAKKTGGFLKVLSSVAAYVPGGGSVSKVANYASVGVAVVGKGYVIKTTSYLYKLVWNEETAATFYNDYWIDENNFDENKKHAFDNSNLFKLKYIGSQNAWADIQSTAFSTKSNEQLIRRSTVKATNKAIAKLQRKYDKFKTKSPIISVGPIAAKIGLKEGLEKGNKFEVLEQVLNKKGLTQYKRVGVVTVDKRHIWDNRFMANQENYSQFKYTTFKGASKKAQVGMFLRQLN